MDKSAFIEGFVKKAIELGYDDEGVASLFKLATPGQMFNSMDKAVAPAPVAPPAPQAPQVQQVTRQQAIPKAPGPVMPRMDANQQLQMQAMRNDPTKQPVLPPTVDYKMQLQQMMQDPTQAAYIRQMMTGR